MQILDRYAVRVKYFCLPDGLCASHYISSGDGQVWKMSKDCQVRRQHPACVAVIFPWLQFGNFKDLNYIKFIESTFITA